MGGCCQRTENINIDKNNSYNYTPEETNGVMKTITKPELKLEENKLELTEEELQLTKIINRLKYLFSEKVKIFTEIELFNLAIYYKENYINSDYVIFDMRISSEQKEYYLKKIKHINYTFDQIKNIKKIKKFELLHSFIDNKKVIIIIPNYYLNQNNNCEGYKKVEEYPVELCNLLYDINNNISFKILNTSLSNKDNKNNKSIKFEDFLSVFHSYDIVPYILFTYNHMTTFYKEGYFFISFLNNQIFSFEDYIANLQKPKKEENTNNGKANELGLKDKFLSEMNITTIFNIDNSLEKEFEIKDYQYQKNVFKEIIINKNDIKKEIIQVNAICDWLRQEIKKGHSCYFNIENILINENDNANENKESNWIFVIIILMTLVTEVDHTSVLDYLKEKMIYIEKLDKVFANNNINEEEISETLSKY